MSGRVVAVVVILGMTGVLAAPLSSGGVGSGPTVIGGLETPDAASVQPTLALGATEFDRTLYSIRVYRNGSARWTFTYITELQNDTERQNFKRYAERFRENRTDLYREFVDRARALTRAGTNATGRSMNATTFARDARVRPLGNTGVVEMSFTWTAFAQQRDSGGVLVSDVFQGGIYIRDDQRLRFIAGPALAFETVEPEPTKTSAPTLVASESITWVGERTFSDRHPYVAFQPASAVHTPTTTAPAGGEDGTVGRSTAPGTTDVGTRTSDEKRTTTAAAGGGDGQRRLLLVFVALVLVGTGVIVAAWINGTLDLDTSADEHDGQSVSSGAGVEAGAGAGADTQAVDGSALLEDSDRVLQLLEENGGRMKQTAIVDETEWSKSKVSMLLSDMEEAGDISKLRVGRENIISLPGAEPEAARSPFDDLDEEES